MLFSLYIPRALFLAAALDEPIALRRASSLNLCLSKLLKSDPETGIDVDNIS